MSPLADTPALPADVPATHGLGAWLSIAVLIAVGVVVAVIHEIRRDRAHWAELAWRTHRARRYQPKHLAGLQPPAGSAARVPVVDDDDTVVILRNDGSWRA